MSLLSIQKIRKKEQLETHYMKMLDNCFISKNKNSHIIYLISNCLNNELFFKEFYQSLFVRSLTELINVTDVLINYQMFYYSKENALNEYLNRFNYRVSNYNNHEDYEEILNYELTTMMNYGFTFPHDFFESHNIKYIFLCKDEKVSETLNNLKILNEKNTLEKKLNKPEKIKVSNSRKI